MRLVALIKTSGCEVEKKEKIEEEGSSSGQIAQEVGGGTGNQKVGCGFNSYESRCLLKSKKKTRVVKVVRHGFVVMMYLV